MANLKGRDPRKGPVIRPGPEKITIARNSVKRIAREAYLWGHDVSKRTREPGVTLFVDPTADFDRFWAKRANKIGKRVLGIILRKVDHEMPFADRVMTMETPEGIFFNFVDSTRKTHGEYMKGNIFSPAPENALGAVRMKDGDKTWYWVIQEKMQ